MWLFHRKSKAKKRGKGKASPIANDRSIDKDRRDAMAAVLDQIASLSLSDGVASKKMGHTAAAAVAAGSPARGTPATLAGTNIKKQASAKRTPAVAPPCQQTTPVVVGADEWTPPPTQNLVTPDAPPPPADRNEAPDPPPNATLASPFPPQVPTVLNFQPTAHPDQLQVPPPPPPLSPAQVTPPPTIAVVTPPAPGGRFRSRRKAPRVVKRSHTPIPMRFTPGAAVRGISRSSDSPMRTGLAASAAGREVDEEFWDYYGIDSEDELSVLVEEEEKKPAAVAKIKYDDGHKSAAIVKEDDDDRKPAAVVAAEYEQNKKPAAIVEIEEEYEHDTKPAAIAI